MVDLPPQTTPACEVIKNLDKRSPATAQFTISRHPTPPASLIPGHPEPRHLCSLAAGGTGVTLAMRAATVTATETSPVLKNLGGSRAGSYYVCTGQRASASECKADDHERADDQTTRQGFWNSCRRREAGVAAPANRRNLTQIIDSCCLAEKIAVG